MKTPSLILLTANLGALLLSCLLNAQTDTVAAQAAALIGKNDLAAAEAMLAPATAEGSQDAAAFFQLGTLRLRQRRVDDAVAAHEAALKLDGTKAEYFSQFAVALSAKMQGADMMTQAMLATKLKQAFEKSVELDPNHVAGLIGLARYYGNAPEIAGGSPEKAAAFARRVRAMQPFLGELELALIAERDEDFVTAVAHYEAALKLQPKHAGALASAGRALARLGRKEEARARFEAALELDPKREAARKALAELGARP